MSQPHREQLGRVGAQQVGTGEVQHQAQAGQQVSQGQAADQEEHGRPQARVLPDHQHHQGVLAGDQRAGGAQHDVPGVDQQGQGPRGQAVLRGEGPETPGAVVREQRPSTAGPGRGVRTQPAGGDRRILAHYAPRLETYTQAHADTGKTTHKTHTHTLSK